MQKATSSQFIDEAAIDGWLRRVIEVFESFVIREAGKLQVKFYGAAMTFLKFRCQQVAKKMRIGPTGSGRLLGGGIELGQGSS